MSASVRPSLLLRKRMTEKAGYAEDKYDQISRNAVCPRLWIYFHEQDFVSLPPFPSSLTPSNLDLHFFLPISGALDLCPAWVLILSEFTALVQVFFLCSVAILPLTCVSGSGSGGEEPSCWLCSRGLVGRWVGIQAKEEKTQKEKIFFFFSSLRETVVIPHSSFCVWLTKLLLAKIYLTTVGIFWWVGVCFFFSPQQSFSSDHKVMIKLDSKLWGS